MKRKIIKINENLCNGCGVCIPDCPEGALQVIDGKARLISDLFCDGLGACIKACPQGAMETEVREAEPYDEYTVMGNIVKAGSNVVKAHLKHLNEHGESKFLNQAIDYLTKNGLEVPEYKEKTIPCGCPGMMQKELKKEKSVSTSEPVSNLQSELNNWPIQLKLMNPNAAYLKNAELVIAADCTAFSYANFHKKFLKDKILMMFCPKLDTDLDSYVEKLSNIFENQDIKSITIVHMEVPCCGGVEMVVREALEKVNKTIIIKDYTISLNGEIV